jgi:hypothetical protein
MKQLDGEYPDLIITGTGIRKIHQMTLETYWACEHADVIMGIWNDHPATDAMAREFDADIIDFSYVYNAKDDEERFNGYFQAMMTGLERAYETDGLAVQLGVGHPNIWNTTTTVQRAIGEEIWDLNVVVLPAISADSFIYTMLGIDPATNGIQQYSVLSAVTHDWPLNPDADFFGWLFGRLNLDMGPRNGKTPIERAHEYLCKYYDPELPAFLVRAPKMPFFEPNIVELKLDELKDVDVDEYMGHSLYVPSDGENPLEWASEQPHHMFDEELAEQFYEPGTGRSLDHPIREPAEPDWPNEDLGEFNRKVYHDGDFYHRLQKNPEAVLDEFGFSKRLKKLMLELSKQSAEEGAELSKVMYKNLEGDIEPLDPSDY